MLGPGSTTALWTQPSIGVCCGSAHRVTGYDRGESWLVTNARGRVNSTFIEFYMVIIIR